MPEGMIESVLRNVKIENLYRDLSRLDFISDSWVNPEAEESVKGVPGIPAGCQEDFLPSVRAVKVLAKVLGNTAVALEKFKSDLADSPGASLPRSRVFDPQVLQPDYKRIERKELTTLCEVHRRALLLASGEVAPEQMLLSDADWGTLG